MGLIIHPIDSFIGWLIGGLCVGADEEAAKEARPVIVFVHGGVWASGEKWHYAPMATRLVQEGYVVVVPSYTLYPDVRTCSMYLYSDVRAGCIPIDVHAVFRCAYTHCILKYVRTVSRCTYTLHPDELRRCTPMYVPTYSTFGNMGWEMWDLVPRQGSSPRRGELICL